MFIGFAGKQAHCVSILTKTIFTGMLSEFAAAMYSVCDLAAVERNIGTSSNGGAWHRRFSCNARKTTY